MMLAARSSFRRSFFLAPGDVKRIMCRCSTNSATSSSPTHFQEEQTMKRLDVAVVGLPNAGKSQLLNVLTQSPVSAVSRKRHTTRQGVMGGRTVENTQLVFMDTPGFLKVDQAKDEGLDRELVVTASAEIAKVDFSLLVVDAARSLTDAYKETLVALMLYAMRSQGREEWVDEDDETIEDEDADDLIRPKFAIVMNKVDLVKPKPLLLEYAMELGLLAQESIQYAGQTDSAKEDTLEMDARLLGKLMPPLFYTSALKDDGVDDVLQFLLQQATPCQEWPLDPQQSTTLTAEERVEEIIREKIYRCLHKEVPYNVRQANKLLRVASDRQGRQGVIIHQEILVQTNSHRELVLGSGGRTLGRIKDSAMVDLQNLFQCPVNLHLQVKHVKSRNRDWSI